MAFKLVQLVPIRTSLSSSPAHVLALILTTMSTTTSTTDDPSLQTSPPAFVHTPTSLEYAVTHVFLPGKLPEESDYTLENEHSLARAVCAAAHAYGTHVCGTSEQAHWDHITKMLDNLQASFQSAYMDIDQVVSQLQRMQTGGTLAGSPQIPGCADGY